MHLTWHPDCPPEAVELCCVHTQSSKRASKPQAYLLGKVHSYWCSYDRLFAGQVQQCCPAVQCPALTAARGHQLAWCCRPTHHGCSWGQVGGRLLGCPWLCHGWGRGVGRGKSSWLLPMTAWGATKSLPRAREYVPLRRHNGGSCQAEAALSCSEQTGFFRMFVQFWTLPKTALHVLAFSQCWLDHIAPCQRTSSPELIAKNTVSNPLKLVQALVLLLSQW